MQPLPASSWDASSADLVAFRAVSIADRVDNAPPIALMAFSGASLYGGAAVAIRLFDELGAAGASWLRVTWAAVLLLAWRRGRLPVRPPMVLLAFGVVLGLMNLSIYLAFDRLPLGTAVAIEFIGPIAVAALGDRSWKQAVSVVIAAVGVLLLSGAQGTSDTGGIALALVAGVMWGGYIILGSRSAATLAAIPTLDRLLIAQLVASLVIAPFGIASLADRRPPWWAVGAAAAIGLLSSALPYAIDQVIMRRIGAARFGLLCTLLPVTAAVIGLVVLGQVPTAPEVVGIAMVCIALALGARRAARQDLAV
jgi:inner membrane transporter RhtA